MRQLLVFGDKTFKIEIPDDAKITFGPWSPPTKGQDSHAWHSSGKSAGTLRVYQGSKENIVALFAGVTGFRDLALSYAEQVAVEEGASIWKDDEDGYVREDKVSRRRSWGPGDVGPPAIEAPEEEDIPFEEEPPAPKRRTRKRAT